MSDLVNGSVNGIAVKPGRTQMDIIRGIALITAFCQNTWTELPNFGDRELLEVNEEKVCMVLHFTITKGMRKALKPAAIFDSAELSKIIHTWWVIRCA